MVSVSSNVLLAVALCLMGASFLVNLALAFCILKLTEARNGKTHTDL